MIPAAAPYRMRETAYSGVEPATDTMGFLYTDCAFLAYVERSPGLKKASALYTFFKAEKGNPYRVKKWREEEKEGDYVEVQTMFKHLVPASAMAYVIQNTVK